MNKAKISVIVPIYKAESYLRRCLDSIVGQTCQDLEIILVDDGSPDGCGLICDQYAERDLRIHVFHTENRGPFSARNVALDHATGAYIGFIDADDWIDPNMYEELLRLLTDADADISQCRMENDGIYKQLRSVALGGIATYEKTQLIDAIFREEITHSLNDKLFRAEIWKKKRFPEGVYHADAMTIADIDTYCNKLVRTDAVYYHYNTGSYSITRGTPCLVHIKSQEYLFMQYEKAASRAASAWGDFFICREIPCRGRVIPPGGEITKQDAMVHVNNMHSIFLRHLIAARSCDGYLEMRRLKKFLWAAYRFFPHLITQLFIICRSGRRQP